MRDVADEKALEAQAAGKALTRARAMMRAMAMVGAPAEAPPAPLAIEPSRLSGGHGACGLCNPVTVWLSGCC
ncbi:MAG: hypothetical protein RB191_06545 [Terriglobia bacterium]|nr:hypothetical protein [Terriglobia bacterium]